MTNRNKFVFLSLFILLVFFVGIIIFVNKKTNDSQSISRVKQSTNRKQIIKQEEKQYRVVNYPTPNIDRKKKHCLYGSADGAVNIYLGGFYNDGQFG